MELRNYLEKEVLIFDGAMGTMLQSSGLKTGELPEILNIKEGKKIVKIHKKYIEAGAKVITTNTFGANEIKLKDSGYEVEEIISEAVNNAKKARKDEKVFIALDIGPIGELIEPMGTLKFEEAYEIFKRQVIHGVKCGVDLILIETMTDLYEAKAAILAAKENSDLPVFCTMSFEKDGRTFTGCSVISMTLVLQGLGVDALGINCSLGPKEIAPILDQILNISNVPVMIQANAGLPVIKDGRTTFNISPEEFTAYSKDFIKKGVKVIGGCCGTTDAYIKSLAKELKNIEVLEIQKKKIRAICTPTKVVSIEGIKVIGERINPTGKKLFKEALKNGNIDYILKEAITQVEAGADILDVNVGLPGIDEEQTIVEVIKEIQSILDIPLQIDSNNPKVIEKALRAYNGKAIVNSVNGEDDVLEKILPLVKKYGAAVVGLTLDERGIPETAEERFLIANKIIKKATEYGIAKEDIYIDCLTLTAAAQQKEVIETLKTLRLIKKNLDVSTVLGVSNVSFGLPNRELLNRTFLASCLATGLDLPIINPIDKEMMDTIRAFKVLANEDERAVDYLEFYKNNNKEKIKITNNIDIDNDLFNIIVKGIREEAKTSVSKLLNYKKPMEIINEYIIPALDLMGEKYEKGIIFLPQLIQSAETVKTSFEILKEKMNDSTISDSYNHKIILATVKGDVHDIGKNIVKVLLENYGFDVIDLGKDVAKETIIYAIETHNVKLVGLSALMTTTVKNMEDTIIAIRKKCPDINIIVGGAVLTKEYADSIGANYYAKDAKEAVKIAKEFFRSN